MNKLIKIKWCKYKNRKLIVMMKLLSKKVK